MGLEEMKSADGDFVVSSGHDYTVYPIMCSLMRHCRDKEVVQKHGQWPVYGAHIIFEVWVFGGKRMVRIIHDKQVLRLYGDEFMEISQLEATWRDLLTT